MHERLRDFRPELRVAIDRLQRAGFVGEAYVLTAAMEGAYGSALEMVRAIGAAVTRVQRSVGGAAPVDVLAALEAVLREIGRMVIALAPPSPDPAPTVPLSACGSN